ncbi:Hvo_1808 family surface protein [Natronobiforma cellulositropha]|uniref:Hvo_1808 family surface protein n=1 Tax=Natronobiforma cellulositropha TaxID=1679076 RepID=UPI0021D59B3A|nr:Hvo_1808 family surface protein [Natronobiforma cellulositropha]
MRRVPLFVLVVLLVLAGCADVGSVPPSDSGNASLEGDLGEVNGYAADDEFGFDGDRALSETELEAVTYRAMARIELLRELPFEETVDLEVVGREDHQESSPWTGGESDPFENEVWRAAFVVDGETDYGEALSELYGGSVQGYYADGQVVLVVDDAENPQVDRDVLVHELVHALQDQHVGLTREGGTIDERRAEEGLIEGEANYVPHRYADRCETEWECLDGRAAPAPELGGQPFNVGLFASVFVPYAEGPGFVAHLHETEGWDAVTEAFDERPASTSQVIHPERYPDATPVEVDLEDRSSASWEPDRLGEDENDPIRTETVGEATLFAALYANGVIDRPITDGADPPAPYNYSHPITDGWAGDTLAVYHDRDDETRTGHVWRLAWESETDAARFADAYRDLLETHDAEEVAPDTYVIPDENGFAGAYHLSLEGDELTVVGGPDRESLAHLSDRVATPEPAAATSSSAVTPPVPSGLSGPSAAVPLPERAEADPLEHPISSRERPLCPYRLPFSHSSGNLPP